MNLFGLGNKTNEENDRKTPDKPIPFGYKTSWFAVKADSPETVMDKLVISDRQICNWRSAFDTIFGNGPEAGQVFVTPCFDGWVLIINYDGPANDQDMGRIREIAAQFEEVQYYATHRVVELNCWARFREGRLIRAYYYIGESGEVLWNEGNLTDDERDAGLTMLPEGEIEDWDNVTFPDEESVIQLAAKWSVDPMLEKYKTTRSTGYLCKMA